MNPQLSVILVTRTDLGVLEITLRHLRAQTIRDRLEIIVVAARDFPVPTDIRLVRVEQVTTLAGPQAAGIRAAHAPVVVLGEDHSFPAPDWAEKLLAAHAAGHAAVAPLLLNANPGTLRSWANYLWCFGRYGDPAQAGEVAWLPWHNTSYKRDLLLALGDRLPAMLAVEGLLHEEWRAQGRTLYLHPDTSTRHVNFSRFGDALRQAFVGGRLYASARARHQQWPVAKRLLYAVATPLIPPVRLYRIVQDIRARPQQRHLLPSVIPLLLLGLIMHALGEATGNLLAAGRVEAHYLNYETDRLRHVTSRDREELTARQSAGPHENPASQ